MNVHSIALWGTSLEVLYVSSLLARYINQSGNQLLLSLVALTPWLYGGQMVPSRQFVHGITAGY